MKAKSQLSVKLYQLMLRRGYPEDFSDLVAQNLNTDWTARRMIGYLYQYDDLPIEEIADEMLAILSDRSRIMQKMEMEENNAKWNAFMQEFPLDDGDDDDDGSDE